MKVLDTVRIDSRRKNYLVTLKRKTSIKNWNTVARWAFLYSLSISSKPSKVGDSNDSAVEMSWKVFAGNDYQDIVWLLLKARLIKDSIEPDFDNMKEYFQRYLYRGIHLLINDDSTENIVDMINHSLLKSESQGQPDLY